MAFFVRAVSLVGLAIIMKLCLPFVRWLYAAFFRPAKDLKRAYGRWAVVTGATDGIGRAVALELARRGLHLVLVGRSPAKLAEASDLMIGTQVRTVVWDLSAGRSCGGATRLRQAIAGLEVGLLVNCAGATHPCASYFHEAEEREWSQVVAVNVKGTSHVTHIVLPEMVGRRRGAVVIVGSASSAAVPSFPLHAVYAATKLYVSQFSRSLSTEYKRMGIDVQCQIPFYVATKMVGIEKPSLFIPSPDTFAKSSVRCIGYDSVCTPYWSHAIQWGFLTMLPDFLLNVWLFRRANRKRNRSIKAAIPADQIFAYHLFSKKIKYVSDQHRQ